MKNKDAKTITELADQIKTLVLSAKAELADSLNKTVLKTYWTIGRLIGENEKKKQMANKEFVIALSKRLRSEIGRGYSRSNLYLMRKFYLTFPNFEEIPTQITWSHFGEVLNISDPNARSFYIQESINSKWSFRELKRQKHSMLFERLLLSKGDLNKKEVLRLSREGLQITRPEDILRSPYVLEFVGLEEDKPYKEAELEARLIKHIEAFLLELGRGFMFVGSQSRVTLGNVHHYIDLVFYNKILRAYVLIDLKRNKIVAGDVGQMNMYVNYFKTEINDEFDNEPIGIILSADPKDVAVEYAMAGMTNQIFASQYALYLPEKETLIQEVQRVLAAADEEE